MPISDSSMERRFQVLLQEVAMLREQVEQLDAKVSSMALQRDPGGSQPARAPTSPFRKPAHTHPTPEGADSRGVLPSTAAFLSNAAVLCFLLLLALLLRTIVEREIIEPVLGTYLGVGYAALLILYGYQRHHRYGRVPPLYTVSGTLLLFTVVYETYSRFHLLSAILSYTLLLLAIVSTTHTGMKFRSPVPLILGVLGGALVGITLGFPNLSFQYAALLLLVANLAAYFAMDLRASRWLIWPIVVLSTLFWLVWLEKLRGTFHSGIQEDIDTLATIYFLPLLCLFVLIYIGMVLYSVMVPERSDPLLERILPLATVLWAFPIAKEMAVATGHSEVGVAKAGVVLAAGLLMLATIVAMHKGKSRAPTSTFTVSSMVLLGMALPSALGGNMSMVLVIWSLVAFLVMAMSRVRENRLSRAVAHTFLLFACAVGVIGGTLTSPSSYLAGISLSLLLAILCLVYYYWCWRRSSFRTTFSTVPSVAVLVIAVAYLFTAGRTVLLSLIDQNDQGGMMNFQAGESILITGGAMLLMWTGSKLKNHDVLTTSMIALLLGAIKVFGFDLFHLRDLPLLLSVLVFGTSAAMGSFTWKRWHQFSG